MIIHMLGSEGRYIFHTVRPAQTYSDRAALLSGHFAAPRRVMVWQSRSVTSSLPYSVWLASVTTLTSDPQIEREIVYVD